MKPFEGRLKVICGPMKSGKSKELFLIIDRFKYQKIEYMVFKPSIDTRNKNSLFSRFFSQLNKAVIVDETRPELILDEIPSNLNFPLTVLIDEAHFFSMRLVKVVKTLLFKGISIIVAGLDCDANMRPFGPMGDLLALASEITKLSSVCEKCYGCARVSALKSNNYFFQKKNILIGDEEFIVLCLGCYSKHLTELRKGRLTN